MGILRFVLLKLITIYVPIDTIKTTYVYIRLVWYRYDLYIIDFLNNYGKIYNDLMNCFSILNFWNVTYRVIHCAILDENVLKTYVFCSDSRLTISLLFIFIIWFQFPSVEYLIIPIHIDIARCIYICYRPIRKNSI